MFLYIFDLIFFVCEKQAGRSLSFRLAESVAGIKGPDNKKHVQINQEGESGYGLQQDCQ